jgi:hypothetical protein
MNQTVAAHIVAGRHGRWSFLDRKPLNVELDMCYYAKCEQRYDCTEVCRTGIYGWLHILMGGEYECIDMDDLSAVLNEADRIGRELCLIYNLSHDEVITALDGKTCTEFENWVAEKLSVGEDDVNLLFSVRRLAAMIYEVSGMQCKVV